MSEPSRRGVLKGAGVLAIAAAMPFAASAREPSVLIFDGDEQWGFPIARCSKRFIEGLHDVTVDIVADFELLLSSIEGRKHSLLIVDTQYVSGSLVDWQRQVRRRDSSLPILFNSHHPKEAFPPGAFGVTATGFIQQPYSRRDIQSIVSGYLGRS